MSTKNDDRASISLHFSPSNLTSVRVAVGLEHRTDSTSSARPSCDVMAQRSEPRVPFTEGSQLSLQTVWHLARCQVQLTKSIEEETNKITVIIRRGVEPAHW
jgi:hypothetical protein